MSYQGYFIYKGVAYGVGTKVLLSDTVNPLIHTIPQRKTVEEVKKMPHTFKWGATNGYFNFDWYEDGYNQSCHQYYCYSQVTIHNIDEDIKEIVEPVYVKLVPWQKKALDNMLNGYVKPDIFGGVLLYIVSMVVGALFYSRLLIWVVATVIFVIWLLNQYRTS